MASIIGLLVIGGGFLIFKKWSKPSSPSSLLTVATKESEKSNADALKSLQENLWIDFPHAEEPRFLKTEASQQSTDKPSIAHQTFTDTDALAQQLVNAYFSAAKQTGGSLGDEDVNAIANSLAENINTFEKRSDSYSISDIKISKNDDEPAIKEYGNNLALIIKKYFDPIPENEIQIFKKAVANKDAVELEKLEPLANAYRNTAREAFSLDVPLGFSGSHLTLINYFNDIAQDLNIMEKTFDDPIQSLIALKQYFADAKQANQVFHDLNSYFSSKKIVFGNNEPAEFFKINYLE